MIIDIWTADPTEVDPQEIYNAITDAGYFVEEIRVHKREVSE